MGQDRSRGQTGREGRRGRAQGIEIREALTRGFQKKYPAIQVDFSGMQGVQIAPKLLIELRAGKNTTDIVVTGTTTILEALIPADAVVPVQPFLVGANAATNRFGGAESFSSRITQGGTTWS